MEIINTKPGCSNFHLFENLPKKLYPTESIRHKQKESFNGEFLEDCFVLTVAGSAAARVALYLNPFLNYNGKSTACLGNYECIEDEDVAMLLLNHVSEEAKKKGAEFLIGPMNGSTWDAYRFSIHHDHPNFLLEPYHHLYYNTHFTKARFQSIADYRSSLDRTIPCDPEEVLQKENEFKKLGIKIRSINMDDYEGELRKLYPFISLAFKDNFLFTPIKWETFYAKYIEAASIINPEYVLIAENNTGEIVGFIFCYHDLYNTQEKSLVVKTVVRAPEKQWSGLGHVMANLVLRKIKTKGYHSLIHAFFKEQGTSTGLSNSFLGKNFKSYILYGKYL